MKRSDEEILVFLNEHYRRAITTKDKEMAKYRSAKVVGMMDAMTFITGNDYVLSGKRVKQCKPEKFDN